MNSMYCYIWVNEDSLPVSKAWPYQDDKERMVEDKRPLADGVILRAGTRKQLNMIYGVKDQDITDSE